MNLFLISALLALLGPAPTSIHGQSPIATPPPGGSSVKADTKMAPTQCSTAAGIIASLKKIPVPISVVSRYIAWAPAAKADDPDNQRLRLSEVDEISGPCARYLEGVYFSNYQFTTGRVISSSTAGWTEWRPNTVFLNTIDSSQSHPAIPHATFIMAARAERFVEGKTTGLYMGLWKNTNGWFLASFAQCGQARFGRPIRFLSSSIELRGLTYGAAPDISAGGLQALSPRPDGKTWLIEFSWFHPNSFREVCV